MVAGKQLQNVRVLAVDDDDTVLRTLRRILESEAACVTTAESAQVALRLFPQVQPDVLLSDIGMPEMDGYEFISHLRRLGVEVPAVAITSYSGPEDRRRAIVSGFQNHLAKPASSAELVAIVVQLCGANKQAS